MSKIVRLAAVAIVAVTAVAFAEEVPYEAAEVLRSGQGEPAWVRFNVEPNALYDVRAASLAFTPVLRVEIAGEEPAPMNGGAGAVAQRYVISTETTSLRIGVGSADERGGNYLVSVDSIPIDGTLRGTVTRNGELDSNDYSDNVRGHVDWYRVRFTSDDPTEVTLSSDEFDTVLTVLKSDGSEMSNDDSGDSTNSALTLSSARGSFAFIGVGSYGTGEAGSYTLQLSPIEPSAALRPGQTVSGILESGDSSSDHLYALEGEPGTQLMLRLESSEFDTVLRVSSPDSGDLENDDAPGGSGTNSQLFLEIGPSGSALVSVESFGGDTGQYQLSALRYVAAGDTSRRADGYVLSAGERLEQVIGVEDRDVRGRLAHRFRYPAEQGEEVTVTLRSTAFDTYLIVNGPEGDRFEDDDSGGERNSQLTFEASDDGFYEIFATSYGRDAVGPYTIEVISAGTR